MLNASYSYDSITESHQVPLVQSTSPHPYMPNQLIYLLAIEFMLQPVTPKVQFFGESDVVVVDPKAIRDAVDDGEVEQTTEAQDIQIQP